MTITHTQQDCPGRRPDLAPDLIGPAERLEALGQELGVTSHSVVWGASCILWAEPEHVAYALVEAPNLEAVERYVECVTPAGWETRTLPVFSLPGQLAAVRQLLAAPSPPFATSTPPADLVAEAALPPPESPVEPADEPVTDQPSGNKPVTDQPSADEQVADQPADEQVTERPDQQATRMVEQVVVPLDRDRVPTDSGAVTRFVESPAIAHSAPAQPEVAAAPTPRPPASMTEILEGLDSSPPGHSQEVSTVILEQPDTRKVPGVRLLATAGPAQGAIFEVGVSGATVGRLPENPIHLSDGRLSRRHARIEFRDGEYWLSDLGSQNGTLVNGRPVSEAHRLQAGDSIELGTSRLTVMPDDTTD